jgi:DNA-binding helix-hairpin-helix protein with protein kinase domain
MAATYLDSKSAGVTLGAEIARGGEGAIFEVVSRPEIAAKVYHKEVTAEKAQKLRQMVQMNSAGLNQLAAWPMDLLFRSGRPVGVLMLKVSGQHKDIHKLYSPKSRRVEFTRADWRFLIHTMANVARAFAAVHDTGCVIGDVNHSGILVDQKAMVKLIDCDSFQVPAGNRYFLCEVGVDNYTPPELQGKPFAGVVRTQNHDVFGLAVMAFLMLFMGRHPFAGRYLGSGDMPIATAIKEGRFAYGAQRKTLLMEQPPGTPTLDIVGGEVARLFEQAFSLGTVGGGRPSARTWVQALANLEKQLVQCSNVPWHWHLSTLPRCPWCPMEAALGVSLFPAVVASDGTGTFSIDRFWQSVSAIPHPGPAPAFELDGATPSAKVKTLKQRLKARMIARIAVGFGAAFVALAVAKGSLFLPALCVGASLVWLIGRLLDKGAEVKQIRGLAQQAEDEWNRAFSNWTERASAKVFERKKAELEHLRWRWESLTSLREKQRQELQAQHVSLQLEVYLDQFRLENAKIDKIGPSRKQTLESYGIETAADLSWQALERVPGFGPVMRSTLMAWRSDLEKRFVFNPAKPIDPSHYQKIDQETQKLRSELQNKMEKALVELRQTSQLILSFRQQQQPALESLAANLRQAKADLQALSKHSRN